MYLEIIEPAFVDQQLVGLVHQNGGVGAVGFQRHQLCVGGVAAEHELT